jgi:hypothetical protein
MLWQHLGVNKLLKEAYESGTVSDVRLDVKNRNCLSLDRPRAQLSWAAPSSIYRCIMLPAQLYFRKCIYLA